MVEKFKAFIVNQDENGKVSQEYKTLTKMIYLREMSLSKYIIQVSIIKMR